MSKYYYAKRKPQHTKRTIRFIGITITLLGLTACSYVFFPLISWQIYFAPVFANQDITAPIPKTTIVTQGTIQSLLSSSGGITGIDYTNAENWFPDFKPEKTTIPVSSYQLTIEKLGIQKATVSTTDYDLANHLVQYAGTALPPENGNAVIFGHSTLPQLFNPKDYKTIFANAYKLTIGNEFVATVNNIDYTYKIFQITVVDPSDTSMFTQSSDASFITLVTCTPPGTTWKRLEIKAKLQNLE